MFRKPVDVGGSRSIVVAISEEGSSSGCQPSGKEDDDYYLDIMTPYNDDKIA